MVPIKLIYKEAHRAAWTKLPWDDRLGIASLAAVEAEQHFDPARGALSTLLVTAIRNALQNEVSKNRTRHKYDGVQVSCLLESQIPADHHIPCPERQAIFRDELEHLGEDAKAVVNLALHTPPATRNKKPINILKGIQDRLGWPPHRFYSAVNEVKAIFTT